MAKETVAAKAASKEVVAVKPEETAVAAYDYSQYAGAGFEGSQRGDFKPSFLRILHGNSPQITNGMDGAKPGLIIDSVTNELFESANFVPAKREHVYVAWKPRSDGGGGGQGFGGVYQLNDPLVVEALKTVDKFERGDDGKIKLPFTPDGEYQLIETVYFHGVQTIDEAMFPVSVPFSSTGMPVAAGWFTTLFRATNGGKIPLFAFGWRLNVVKQQKGQNTWFNFAPTWANGTAKESMLAPDSDLFKAGAAVHDAFKAGTASVDYAAAGKGDAPAGAKDGAIPF